MDKTICSDHGKQALYICNEHNIPICGDCLIKVHFVCVSRKSVISVDDRMMELRKECNQLIDEVRKNNELAGVLIAEKKRRKEEVTGKCMEFRQMIEITRKELNKILDEKEEESLKEINEIELEEKTLYNDFLTKMTEVQIKLSSLITELEKIQNESCVQLASDLRREKGYVREISDIIRKCSTNVQECDLQYQENQEVMEVLKGSQTFGKISKRYATDQCQSESARNSASGQKDLSSADMDVERGSDIFNDEVSNISEETLRCILNEFGSSLSVVNFQEGDANARKPFNIDRGSTLQKQSDNDDESPSLTPNIFPRRLNIKWDSRSITRENQKGESNKCQMEHLCSLELSNLYSKTDIAALPNGRLVVSAATTDIVQVIEKDGAFAFCSTDFKNPQGIVHIDGNRIALATANGVFILVVQTSQLFQLQKLCEDEIFGIYYRNQILAMCANNCVLIASADGKVISKIERFGLVIKYQLQKPRHVAIDLTGKFVYISDEEARKVVCSTIKGAKKWEHQLPNAIPKGIESCENIYVAVPEKNSIIELSPSGEFLASYCLELSPYGLHITAEGKLYVTNHEIIDDKFVTHITILQVFVRAINNV